MEKDRFIFPTENYNMRVNGLKMSLMAGVYTILMNLTESLTFGKSMKDNFAKVKWMAEANYFFRMGSYTKVNLN